MRLLGLGEYLIANQRTGYVSLTVAGPDVKAASWGLFPPGLPIRARQCVSGFPNMPAIGLAP